MDDQLDNMGNIDDMDNIDFTALEQVFGKIVTEVTPDPVDTMNATMDALMAQFGVTACTESWTDMAEDNEKEHKETKRLKWVSLCGSMAWTIDPATGLPKRQRVTCNYYRLCEYCAGVRAGKFYDRYVEALEQTDGNVGIVQGDKKTIRKLIRHLKANGGSKLDYWRVPTEDGALLFFNLAYLSVTSELEIGDIDWHVLAITPEHTRVSGDLGKVEEQEKTGIVVNVKCLIVDGLEDGQVRRCFDQAVDDMYRAHPTYDAERISYCCWERIVTAEKHIKALGGKIVDKFTIKVRVSEDEFTSWDKSLSEVRAHEKVAKEVMEQPVKVNSVDFETAYNELFKF